MNTPPNLHAQVRIHPYSLQQGHISMRGSKMKINLFFKCRSAGRIGGSNPRVDRNGFAGRGDPNCYMACISRVSQDLAGRVGSGEEVFEMSRIRSGRVTRLSNFTGRVGSGGFQSRGPGRVDSGGSQISRVRSGRIMRFSNLTGRVGSGRVRRFSKSRGSGRVRSRHLQHFADQVGSADWTSTMKFT